MYNRLISGVFLLASTALVACSGGGNAGMPNAGASPTPRQSGSSTPTPVPSPTPSPSPTPTPLPNSLATHVLVVANSNIASSVTLANSYMQGRSIPVANLLALPLTSTITSYTISQANLAAQIFTPIANAVTALGAKGTRIDFVVMMYGTPYVVSDSTSSFNGYSVDGILSQATGAFPAAGDLYTNSYYGAPAPFSSATYKMLLVTRLDGRSVADVQSLINQSLASDGTHPNGEFFFDLDPDRTGGYEIFNEYMMTAQSDLAAAGFNAVLDNTTAFIAPASKLAGYSSWGSNDYHFSQTAYDSLTWVPGGLAETAVSTSASNIRTPGGGQSQIADLIHEGVTGVHGDVSEPYLNAIPDPQVLFPAYTSGRNLAESYWGALEVIVWKEIVIGDPLCSPYASSQSSSVIRRPELRRYPAPSPASRLPI